MVPPELVPVSVKSNSHAGVDNKINNSEDQVTTTLFKFIFLSPDPDRICYVAGPRCKEKAAKIWARGGCILLVHTNDLTDADRGF